LVWGAVLVSGVHATIAGVALGFVTPVVSKGDRPSAGEWLEDVLHPWTSFVILPVFALASAGVRIDRATLGAALDSRITLGIVLGLVVGKPLGIYSAVVLAKKLGLAEIPAGVHGRDIAGLAVVAGIGFTVSLFITELAFDTDLEVREATIGVLGASLLAAAAGGVLLHRRGHRREKIKE
jgi:Na+:H+ antiporter, NhaA family